MYNDEHMEEWIMATQYAEEFKKDAVRYWKEHPELGIGKSAVGGNNNSTRDSYTVSHKEFCYILRFRSC